MSDSDREQASRAVISWYNNVRVSFPYFVGRLYILPYGNEDWVAWPVRIKNKSVNMSISKNFELPYRPVWSSISTPTNFILLAFMDESHNTYHGGNYTPTNGRGISFDIPDINQNPPLPRVQPTSEFKNHYGQHINWYLTEATQNNNFFRGILYPIVNSQSYARQLLLLNAIGAIESRTLSNQELLDLYNISSNNTNYTNLSAVTANNPYNEVNLGANPPGLKNYGWNAAYNKISPASSVFNDASFNDELISLILNIR
jgi:hypothetical protein